MIKTAKLFKICLRDKEPNIVVGRNWTEAREKEKKREKTDFHFCLMSHFTTHTVYNILPCKQLNSLSQALKSKHSDKVNSFKEPERQAVTKASSCL